MITKLSQTRRIENNSENNKQNNVIAFPSSHRYTFGMFKKGYTKRLETEDLYNPLREDQSSLLGDRLEK